MASEYQRFLKIGNRELRQPPDTGERLEGKRVLVTGGTGCIGSELVRQLLDLPVAKVGSVSIDASPRRPRCEYYYGDIRDSRALDAVMRRGWDVVFHTAAQRDPGLAEIEVQRTVSTNVLGMANVLRAAESHGIEQFVFASTGKALRPFSPDTYTATKRTAEWLLASSTIRYRSGGRFTHVVDNSIIHRKLLAWARAGEPIRLHADGIMFYAQSAKESAQLLIGSAEHAAPGVADIHAIANLEMPISLTDMAHDVVQQVGSSSEVTVAGYDRGYEEVPFPGLYDPETAFDVSPLVNAFEAAVSFRPYAAVDAFPLEFADTSPEEREIILQSDLRQVSWLVMAKAMAAANPATCQKVAKLCAGRNLSEEHARMLRLIQLTATSELLV